MRPFVLLFSTALLSGAAVKLATRYEEGGAVRVEVDTRLELETTTSVEGVEGAGGNMPASSVELTLHEAEVDHVAAAEDGKPRKVERAFEALDGKATLSFGDRTREVELESPLDGVTLDLERDAEGEVTVKVVDGRSPGDEALAHHVPELCLDALLPPEPVEEGASWELDGDAIRRALRLDVARSLHAPPAPQDDGGEGRGGRRRGAMMAPGAGELRLLEQATWKGQAKLVSADEEQDGEHVARIAIELSAEGEIEEPERGGGGRAFEPAAAALATTCKVELEGELSYSLAAKRPRALSLEGEITVESVREREREGRTMKITRSGRGTLRFGAKVGAAK